MSSPTDTLYHTNLPNVRGEPAGRDLPGLWSECLELHGETAAPLASAEEPADILYRLPVGYLGC